MNTRKDSQGNLLNKGESQRENYYVYQYTDVQRKRRTIYAKTLTELREKEKSLAQDIHDGLDTSLRASLTLNDAFDRYFADRTDLKHSSQVNYHYLFDHYVRDGFGTWKLASLSYSDFRAFYSSLVADYGLSKKTLLLIHSILNQVMRNAVRDNILRSNPADGVVQELSRKNGWQEKKRHALTPEQQSAFLQFTMQQPEYEHYTPLLVFLLGTGCRIGEALGLRWKKDIDLEQGLIHITHSLQYRKLSSGKTGHYISTPKTASGNRTIPMISQVRDALLTEQKRKKERTKNKKDFHSPSVDGYTDFVFLNQKDKLYTATDVNRVLYRIVHDYNEQETILAKQEHRLPNLLPTISCHHLRHTFCSRLCENETNLKVIQDIMGHASITTTMNRYAEVTEKRKTQSMFQLEDKIFII